MKDILSCPLSELKEGNNLLIFTTEEKNRHKKGQKKLLLSPLPVKSETVRLARVREDKKERLFTPALRERERERERVVHNYLE